MKNLSLALSIVMAWIVSVFAVETPTITPLMVNGPSKNRVNIVFLSEAYVASQKDIYFNDVNIAVEKLFSRSPFKEYRTSFNVSAVWVASKDSLLAVVKRGEETRTYFGEWGGLSPSSSKIYNVSRSFFGKDDPIVVILLINDNQVGDSGGQGLAVNETGRLHHDPFVNNEMFSNMVVHEFGHALSNLKDETKGLSAMKPGQTERDFEGPFINITTETSRSLISWKYWIDITTPIPTPNTGDYADKIGLFEGANYYTGGWYRPSKSCTMGSFTDWNDMPPFCQVCREAIVKTIYKYIDPTAELVSDVGENTTVFSLSDLPEPADHSLSVQWLVDGNVVATNVASFPATDTEIGYGRHRFSVTVVDSTSFVRYDPDNLLVKSREWDVISLPLPDFTNDGIVDFNDFFLFADHFGLESTTVDVQKYDLDWDGKIGFGDFFLFADQFGQSISKKQIFGITSSFGGK